MLTASITDVSMIQPRLYLAQTGAVAGCNTMPEGRGGASIGGIGSFPRPFLYYDYNQCDYYDKHADGEGDANDRCEVDGHQRGLGSNAVRGVAGHKRVEGCC